MRHMLTLRSVTRSPGRRVWPAAVLVGLALSAWAADVVNVESWTTPPLGHRGIPPPWQKQSWGSPSYDFTVREEEGRRVLHLKSAGDSSNISLDIKDKVNLRENPVLEWSWKVVTLPRGADSRRKETDDQAAQLYVVWPRFPEAVRSRIIGYIWDTTVPAGTIVKSQKAGTVTYVVVRSGPAELGQWLTERRNVREDFRRVYGEEPDDPGGVSIGIDSDDVKSAAESFFGPLVFRKP